MSGIVSYSLKDKIETLGDMVDRLSTLSELLIEEDIDSSDHAARAAKILSSIRNEYKERYYNTYEKYFEEGDEDLFGEDDGEDD